MNFRILLLCLFSLVALSTCTPSVTITGPSAITDPRSPCVLLGPIGTDPTLTNALRHAPSNALRHRAGSSKPGEGSSVGSPVGGDGGVHDEEGGDVHDEEGDVGDVGDVGSDGSDGGGGSDGSDGGDGSDGSDGVKQLKQEEGLHVGGDGVDVRGLVLKSAWEKGAVVFVKPEMGVRRFEGAWMFPQEKGTREFAGVFGDVPYSSQRYHRMPSIVNADTSLEGVSSMIMSNIEDNDHCNIYTQTGGKSVKVNCAHGYVFVSTSVEELLDHMHRFEQIPKYFVLILSDGRSAESLEKDATAMSAVIRERTIHIKSPSIAFFSLTGGDSDDDNNSNDYGSADYDRLMRDFASFGPSMDAASRLGATGNATVDPEAVYLHIDSNILEGLVTGFILLFILAVGFYQLFSIQTPDRFEVPKKEN